MAQDIPTDAPPAGTVAHSHARSHRLGHTLFGLSRIALGAVFLWAFLDKLFGLGYATPAARAWVNGGSPTKGYLGSSTGPLADLFKAMAGNPATDALFMAGLCGVGLALLLGIGMRPAAVSGALMLAFMYASHPPWVVPENGASTNPAVDDHVVYALVLLGLAMVGAGRWLGLGAWWSRLPIVQKWRWLA